MSVLNKEPVKRVERFLKGFDQNLKFDALISLKIIPHLMAGFTLIFCPVFAACDDCTKRYPTMPLCLSILRPILLHTCSGKWSCMVWGYGTSKKSKRGFFLYLVFAPITKPVKYLQRTMPSGVHFLNRFTTNTRDRNLLAFKENEIPTVRPMCRYSAHK